MASVEQLLNIGQADIQKMKDAELRKVVQQLASAGNKRLQRLEQNTVGRVSPALRGVTESGRTRFSTRGKNLNQLRNEYKAVSEFLNTRTSTIKGVARWKHSVEKTIGETFTNTQFVEFGEIMRDVRKSIGREALESYGSTEVSRYIRREMVDPRNKDDGDIVDSVIARVNGLYKEHEKRRLAERGDIDGFYDIDGAEEDELPY